VNCPKNINKALENFQESLCRTSYKHGELTQLRDDGWRENCPDIDYGWSFWHKDFPGVTIWWNPGQEPKTR
jgi:hypothetical protein